MVTAIVLINVERQKMKEITQDLLAIDGVAEVYTVAGEYDLVAIVRAKDNRQLSEVIADKMLHQLRGITHTKTLIALNVFSRFELEKIFHVPT